MNLYKIWNLDRDEGTCISWRGTQADAKAAKKEMEQLSGTPATIEPIDVPTDKPGLLAWLNTHFTRDNG